MLCPNCEAENRDTAKFCDECGFPLAGGASGAPRAVAPESDLPRESETGREPGEGAPADAAPENQEADDPDAVPAPEEAAVGEDPDDSAGIPDEAHADGTPDGEDEPAGEPGESGAEEDLPSGGRDLESAGEAGEHDGIDVAVEPHVHDDFDAEAAYRDAGNDGWSPDITMQMPRIQSDQDPESRDFLASETKKRQRRKLGKPAARGIAVGIAVAAIVAAIVAITYFAGVWGGKFVPDVTGMTEADARTVLVDDGFEVRSTQVKSDDTEGLVLLMDPGAGSRADEGSEVVIHVATARSIPEVVGKGSEEAVALLVEAGYEDVQITYEKSNDEENIVLAVAPETGTRAKSNTTVTLTVSEGYYVPDIAGMQIEEAREAIREEGLEPRAIYVDTNEYVEGTLIGTEPEAGTKVSEGETVTIHMARPRGAELESLTQGLLAPGNAVTIGGNSYVVETLGWVSYQGNDTVAYTITARPYITFFGETLYTSNVQTLSGSVVWSESNNLISIS